MRETENRIQIFFIRSIFMEISKIETKQSPQVPSRRVIDKDLLLPREWWQRERAWHRGNRKRRSGINVGVSGYGMLLQIHDPYLLRYHLRIRTKPLSSCHSQASIDIFPRRGDAVLDHRIKRLSSPQNRYLLHHQVVPPRSQVIAARFPRDRRLWLCRRRSDPLPLIRPNSRFPVRSRVIIIGIIGIVRVKVPIVTPPAVKRRRRNSHAFE